MCDSLVYSGLCCGGAEVPRVGVAMDIQIEHTYIVSFDVFWIA